jgi:hypothetical protein
MIELVKNSINSNFEQVKNVTERDDRRFDEVTRLSSG